MKNLAIILAAVGIAAFVPFISHGEIRDPRDATMCTMQYDPVCGEKNGVKQTYGNSCVAGSQGATILYKGECTDGGGTSGSVGADVDVSVGAGASYTPPAGCTAWFDGCNSCGKDEDGNSFCTLRACVGDPAPGYCTSYDKPVQDGTTDPDQPVSSGSGSASVSGQVNGSAGLTGNTSTGVEPGIQGSADANAEANVEVPKPNIFVRIFTSISAWFTGIF